jgi:hypothetical protein
MQEIPMATMTAPAAPVKPSKAPTCPRSGRPLYPAPTGGWTTEAPKPAAEVPLERLSAPRKVAPAREPRGVCRLTLSINGQSYTLRSIPSDWHAAAWSLRKVAEPLTVYHVTRDHAHGPECDCPDATYRERACKHVKSLVACGLL